MKRIEIKKENILVDEDYKLKNYWYRLIVYLIQRKLVEDEENFISEVGENKYESFCELTESVASDVEENNFLPSSFDSNLCDIGTQIEEYLANDIEMQWNIEDVSCVVKPGNIREWAINYFDNMIFPYLQLVIGEIVEIECESSSLKEFFIENLEKKGIDILKKVKSAYSSVAILKNDSAIVEWTEDYAFYIKNDLFGRIPIEIRIEEENKIDRKVVMYICFPFYKKGDLIKVETFKESEKWYVLAENEDNNLEYKREISVC